MACAAQPGQVSDTTLAQVGLSGMHQMTDVQGMAIRGNGFAVAGGIDVAVVPGAISAHGAAAGVDGGKGGLVSTSSNAYASSSISVTTKVLGITVGSCTTTITASASGGACAAYCGGGSSRPK
jgi:hypothetical protein